MPLPADPLAWAIKRFRDGEQMNQYARYEAYYAGDQDLSFATPKFEQAFGRLFQAFSYNRSASVVDAIADRLRITGFQAANEQGDAQAAQDLWDANRMDKREGEVNVESLAEGDAYVITWPHPDTGLPVIWPQDARCVRVLYDDEQPGLVILAAKLWRQDDDSLRLNLFFPDRLEKYITRNKWKGTYPQSAAAFERYQPEGDLAWPLVYDWFRPNQPSIPVHHFGNNARTGRYGRSELADVIPLQDALNKTLSDLIVASEFSAYRQKWATGVKPAKDPATGRAVPPWDVGADRILGAEAEGASFGTFDSSDLNQMIATCNMFDLAIARVSRVPVHYLGLSSDFPSGESLKTAEAPFVKKVVDRQTAFGNVWEDAMTLALRMQGIDLTFQLEAVYESAEPRSEMEKATLFETWRRGGLSVPSSLRMIGESEHDIALAQQESEAEIERARRAFDAGEVDLGDQEEEGVA